MPGGAFRKSLDLFNSGSLLAWQSSAPFIAQVAPLASEMPQSLARGTCQLLFDINADSGLSASLGLGHHSSVFQGDSLPTWPSESGSGHQSATACILGCRLDWPVILHRGACFPHLPIRRCSRKTHQRLRDSPEHRCHLR